MSAKLVQRRDVLKNLIKRALAASNELQNASEREIKVKLDMLERNFTQCFEVHVSGD